MVMLLLSMLVTALVQAVLHLLGTRSANLQWGLERVLNQVLNDPTMATQVARDIVERPRLPMTSESTRPGAQAPSTASHAQSGPGPIPPAPSRRLRNRAFNPPQTWIMPEDLPRMVQAHCSRALSPTDLDQAAADLQRIDPYLRERFKYHTRLITIAVSALVAFGFQVSATDLLARLTTDKALRDDFVSQAVDLRDQAESIVNRVPTYEQVSEDALDSLANRHPELRAKLEEASGIGDTKYVLWDELERALANTPGRQAIVEEYKLLLDEYHAQAVKDSLADSQAITQKLAGLNIQFWADGWEYYTDGSHWVGVAMTAVLLTLGAPFWFKMLNNLIQLRDALKPQEQVKGEATDAATASVATTAATAAVAAVTAVNITQPTTSGGVPPSATPGPSQFRNFTP